MGSLKRSFESRGSISNNSARSICMGICKKEFARMRGIVFLSILLSVSLNIGPTKSQEIDFANIATAFLTNNDFRALLESPQTAATLTELLDNYNSTGNISVVLNTIVSDPQVSAIAAGAAKIIVESLTKSALTESQV